MRRPASLLAALIALVGATATAGALALPGPAGAQQPPAVALELRSERGQIFAVVRGPDGATATIAERVGDELVPSAPLTLVGGTAQAAPLSAWRCDRTLRRFVVSVPLADGTSGSASAAVRTPPCARRLALGSVPSRLRTGAALELRLRDTWGTGGVRARVCLDPPDGRARCRRVEVPGGRAGATVTRRPRATGRWRIRVRALRGAVDLRRSLRVVPPPRLRLLATGDSMIQIVDSYLDQRLPRATVRSDARISTGISKPFMLDWVAHARRQSASTRPDATVVFLGANDGFPIGSAACCGRAWIEAYARRAEAMMDAYRRGGRARVYWVLLPPAGKPSFARVFGAVNAAIRRAARRAGAGVRLIDVGAVVAPDGRYRHTITRDGRTVVVRQDDQVHLSTAGASIAAGLIVAALRRDGLVA